MSSGLLVCSKSPEPVPLVSVHVDVLVARCIADHLLTQTYVNSGPSEIKTEYVFPLPDGACVVEFSASFAGGRKITGAIRELTEAKKIYEGALQRGDRAALLEEKRPDIFQASIGNLGPGEEVVVAVRYCMELPVEQDALRLTLPASVAPRYTPKSAAPSAKDGLENLSTRSVGKDVSFTVDVMWELGGSVEQMESPTHPALFVQHSETGKAIARLESGFLETDLVLIMKPMDLFRPVLTWEDWPIGGTQALMLSMVPKFELPMSKDVEVTFVVDCSNSMLGDRISQARRAMHICVRSLPHGCSLNILRFGSTFASMAPASVSCSGESRSEAAAYIDSLQADMGGTEMLQPLRFVLESGTPGFPRPGHARQVILITDGQVSNEQCVIDYVRGRGARIFTLGLGSGVSTFLVRGVARVTQGSATFAQDGEDLGPICASMLKKAFMPAVSDLKISWPPAVDAGFELVDVLSQQDEGGNDDAGPQPSQKELSFFDPKQTDPKAFRPRENIADAALKKKKLQQAPQRPPVIFQDSHFCAFALYPSGTQPSGDVQISGQTPAGLITLRLPLPCAPVTRGQGLVHRMAARALIKDIEEGDAVDMATSPRDAVQLSLHFSVLCRATAFVVVDERDGREHPVTTQHQLALEAVQKASPKKAATRALTASSLAPRRTYDRDWRFLPASAASAYRPPCAVTNAVSWRSGGIKHKKNEVFLDIIEKVTYLVGSDGAMLSSDIQGALKMLSCLSGMPEVKLLLNGKLPEEFPHFHMCARLPSFTTNDPVISFIPPDGEFELMAYRSHLGTKPPVQIRTLVAPTTGDSKTEYVVCLRASPKATSAACNVEVRIPVPSDAEGVEFAAPRCSRAEYVSDQDVVVWHVKQLQGQELALTMSFRRSRPTFAETGLWPPVVRASFEIHNSTASGLAVRNLKIIEKSGYEAAQRIRYVTRCGDSSYRLPF